MKKFLILLFALLLVSCGGHSASKNQTAETYPFFDSGWKQASDDSVSDKNNLYDVFLSDNKISYMPHIDNSDVCYKVLQYEPDNGTGSMYIFIGYVYFEENCGLYCIPCNWEEDIYCINNAFIRDIFVYNDEIYYLSNNYFGMLNFMGKLKYDAEKDIWADDENFNLQFDGDSGFQSLNPMWSHCIDNEGNLYLLSSKGIFLYQPNTNTIKLVVNRDDWNYYQSTYQLIKIDDTFYTGTYGGIASYNITTGEQDIWIKE